MWGHKCDITTLTHSKLCVLKCNMNKTLVSQQTHVLNREFQYVSLLRNQRSQMNLGSRDLWSGLGVVQMDIGVDVSPKKQDIEGLTPKGIKWHFGPKSLFCFFYILDACRKLTPNISQISQVITKLSIKNHLPYLVLPHFMTAIQA